MSDATPSAPTGQDTPTATPAPAPATPEATPAAAEGDKGKPVDGDGGVDKRSTLGDAGRTGEQGSDGDGKPAGADELQITLPEGAEVDDATLGEFKKIATEVGLTSENASKLVAWDIARQDERAKAWDKQEAEWAKEIETDPDYGGDKLEATKGYARRALKHFGGGNLALELESRGMGDHPGLIRTFARIGQAMSEDNSVGTGGVPSGGKPDKQAILRREYPTMFDEKDGSPKF
jgi:hypothetical protein